MDATSEIAGLPVRTPASNLDNPLAGAGLPVDRPMFERALLAGSQEEQAKLSALLTRARLASARGREPDAALPVGSATNVLERARQALGSPELRAEGIGSEAAIGRIAELLAEGGLDLTHPLVAAHLQPPPLTVAVAADALASVSNASLDTYDSGFSCLAVERWVVGVLSALAGLEHTADGVLTPGGSQSNLLALLLARDTAGQRRGLDLKRDGSGQLPGPLVFCSELAHFSIQRACAALGLGEASVRLVPTDSRRRMRPEALARALDAVNARQTPVAVVATAGTTDFGSVDPLPEIAELTRERGVWLHVDAAYGFGALFSDELAARLSGIREADSITLDLHKLGWQPAPASVLLVAKGSAFHALGREVPYLNPADDVEAGLDGLLGRSLQTTRRPDALKIAATLLAYGKKGVGGMVDACHRLARYAERRVAREPSLELVAPAELTTTVFRYRSQRAELDDGINARVRRQLLQKGEALLGRTNVVLENGECKVCLKLTFMNPTAQERDVDTLLARVLSAARGIELELERGCTP